MWLFGSQTSFYPVSQNTRYIKSCCHYSAQTMLLLLHVSLSSPLVALLKLWSTFFILFSITVFHTFLFHTNDLFAYLSLNLIHKVWTHITCVLRTTKTLHKKWRKCPQFEELRSSVLCQMCFHRGQWLHLIITVLRPASFLVFVVSS